MNITQWKRSTAMVLLAALLGQGCAAPGARLQYLIGDKKTVEHYRDYSTSINYPVESEVRESDPNLFRSPRSITSLEEVKQQPIRVEECIRMALANSTILREDQNFGSPGNPLLANPQRVASVYDSAIQETGFLFGNRGVEAALSEFDPIFTNTMQWGRSEDVQNSANLGIAPGGVLVDETAQFQARLEKSLASSGTVALQHDWNYSQNNNTRLFPSAYTGFLQAEYRQPLLAGAGTEFTRIAGPVAQGIRGVSGVSQGVLISRINADISQLDFEQSVTSLVKDVENKYWDLYLTLQLYDSEVRTFKDLVEFRSVLAEREDATDAVDQAENRVYEADARMKGSLGDVLSAEYRLRRLLGMPLNDGSFLTPVDRPTEAKLVPNWEASLMESLANRIELRRQKWEIKSLELQLSAAKNLTRPRLDFVSNYRVNGFGDKLLGEEDDDGSTDVGYNSAYESLAQGINAGWGLGLQFSMPIGLRLARAQVRNYELRLRKAKAVLTAQEQEIAYELNDSIIKMDQWYVLADSNAKRSDVAAKFAESAELRVSNQEDRDPISIGRVLEAKITSRDASQSYLRSIVEYNKAITEVSFRKGMLLNANSIYLAEGEWNPAAYKDVDRRAQAMTHALDNTHVDTTPGEFVGSPTPNAWEALGNPDRPHVPGVVDGSMPMNQPPIQQTPSAEPNAPEATQESQQAEPLPPAESEESAPKKAPKKPLEKQYEATEFAPQTYNPGPKPKEKPILKAGFLGFGKTPVKEASKVQNPDQGQSNNQDVSPSQKSWRAKTASTGKAALK